MPLTKLAVSLGALAIGTALSAVPASAQNYYSGHSSDSGGYVTNDASGVRTGQIGPRAPKTGEPQRWMNEDRGVYDYGGGAAARGNGFTGGNGGAPATQYKYSVGRNANDGGMTTSAQFNKGEQKTGSASNREAIRSGTDSYSYGGQGQPPRDVPSVNGYTR